jgi:uncharacterized repeat protein (TIGR01451 family)
VFGPSTGGDWDFTFDGAGQPLTAENAYTNIARYPFNGSQFGMTITHGSSACNQDTGYFTIRQLTFGADDSVTSLDVIFEQHCEGGVPALHGELAINATGVSSAALVPDTWLTETESQSSAGNVTYTASVFNSGPVDSAPVTFTQSVPSGSVLVSAESSQGTASFLS